MILAAIALLFARRRAQDIALALGLIAYLVYLLCAGGDFMAGRLLTPPFAIALIVLAVRAGSL